MPKNVRLGAYLGIAILCFVFYGNSLRNGYAMDDHYVIKGNQKVAQGIKGIPNIFTSRYIENDRQNFAYRPVTLAVFAIEYELFGENPFASHLINLLLYLGTCLFLFFLLSRMFINEHWLLPVLVVGLFLIHPIHTEVVNNVKSRDELLSFLFALLAMNSALSFARSRKFWHLLLAALLLGISLLAKLSSLTFFAIIPLVLYFYGNANWKLIVGVFAALLFTYVGIVLGKNALLDAEVKSRELLFMENPLFLEGDNFLSRTPMAFYSIGYYLKLLVAPFPLLFYYGYDHVPIAGWNNIWAWLSMLILIPTGLYTLWKLRTRTVLVFGLAYFFITISMFSNWVRPAVGIIAERFVYIPSLGFCIVLGYFLLKLVTKKADDGTVTLTRKPVLIALSALLLISSAVHVMDRNLDWKDEITLTRNDAKHLKRSAKANALLGDYLLIEANKANGETQRKNLISNALFYYQRSLDVYFDNGAVHNNMGVLNYELGNYEKAISFINQAHAFGTITGNSYYNLGSAQINSGDTEGAILSFESSITTDPNYANSYNQLIQLYYNSQRYQEAYELNIRAFRQFPGQREVIMRGGQQMAEALYGAGSTFYFDLLLQQGLIDASTHQQYVSALNGGVEE